MALERPTGFPDSDWFSVLAAEAAARGDLLAVMSRISWQHAGGHTRFLHWDDVKKGVGRYLIALMGAFADAACAAVRAGRYPPIALDAAVEVFFELAVKQAYWGLQDEKIQATWKDLRFQSPARELRPMVFAAPWHARYLAEIPEILSAIRPGQTEPDSAQANGRSGRRRMVLEPLLKSRGLSVPSWAEKAGVSQAVAYDYLSGKSDPRPANRKALAGALDLDPEDLPN